MRRLVTRSGAIEISEISPLVVFDNDGLRPMAEGGVANGIRTRNIKLHKLGLYH